MKTRFKPKYNIRKGDQVVVIAGDDKDLVAFADVVLRFKSCFHFMIPFSLPFQREEVFKIFIRELPVLKR